MAAKKAKIKFSPFENVRYDVEDENEYDDEDDSSKDEKS
jgi:hypothetical protein